ncbi:MAG: N-acetylmuramoyl-L-alanine amidase [Sedimenticola sp.]
MLKLKIRNRLYKNDRQMEGLRIQVFLDGDLLTEKEANDRGVCKLALDDGHYLLRIMPETDRLWNPDIRDSKFGGGATTGEPTDNLPERIWMPLDLDIEMVGGQPTDASSAGIEPDDDYFKVYLQPVWCDCRAVHPNAVKNRTGNIDLIVIHHTATDVDKINKWVDPNGHFSSSMHYLVDSRGMVTKMTHEIFRTNNAGCSNWKGHGLVSSSCPGGSINDNSIGIEVTHCCKKEYNQKQYDSLIELIASIQSEFGVASDAVIGHSDVSLVKRDGGVVTLGGKPYDPGLEFEWPQLESAGIGLIPKDSIPALADMYGGFFDKYPSECLVKNDKDSANRYGGEVRQDIPSGGIAELQADLKDIGYHCDITGSFDTTTYYAIKMFRQHFFAGARKIFNVLGVDERDNGTIAKGEVDLTTANILKQVRP